MSSVKLLPTLKVLQHLILKITRVPHLGDGLLVAMQPRSAVRQISTNLEVSRGRTVGIETLSYSIGFNRARKVSKSSENKHYLHPDVSTARASNYIVRLSSPTPDQRLEQVPPINSTTRAHNVDP